MRDSRAYARTRGKLTELPRQGSSEVKLRHGGKASATAAALRAPAPGGGGLDASGVAEDRSRLSHGERACVPASMAANRYRHFVPGVVDDLLEVHATHFGTDREHRPALLATLMPIP